MYYQLLLSNGLPPLLSTCPKLKILLDAAKQMPASYKAPSRNVISKGLVDATYNTIRDTIDNELKKEADVFGLSIFRDSATILRRPLINVLGAGVHNHAALLEIADCTGHVAQGYKNMRNILLSCSFPTWKDWTKRRKGMSQVYLIPCCCNLFTNSTCLLHLS